MEKLLDQFEKLEIKCIELLHDNKALRSELYKIKKTNKLLEENINDEKREEISNSKHNQGYIDNEKSEHNRAEKAEYIKEIDECLEILKTMKG